MVSARARVTALSVLTAAIALLALGATSQAFAASKTPPRVGASSHAVRATAPTTDWITPEATFLSGRSVSVTCSSSATDWAASLGAVGLPSTNSGQYYGFSQIELGAMHLSPYVCQGLRLGLDPRARAANALQVSWSVDVLLHESVHLGRLTTNEALAEACARAGLPGELHRLYGVPYYSPEMSALTLAATWFRRTQGASYQGGVCS